MSARDTSQIDSHLPLKPVVFHILLALAEGEAHSYGVIQSVRTQTSDRIHLKTGPFYRHLAKLMDGGLVEESADRPEDTDPRRGASYRLSPLGQEVVAAEVSRLATLVAVSADPGITEAGDA